MFVNTFFTNKQSGIKQSVIKILGLVAVVIAGLMSFTMVARAQSYTQPFQNQTTTLMGKSVQANMYFVKMGYWRLKTATLNLNFQLSQLSNRQTSDVTVTLNGVAVASFRPQATTGLQTKQLDIPTRLIAGTNNLQVRGQLLNRVDQQRVTVAPTPANWLTIDQRSNVNFEYDIAPAESKINSFYEHFTGTDTIVDQQAVMAIPNQPSQAELTASLYALAGQSRLITTEDEQLPVVQLTDPKVKRAHYQMLIARYHRLPRAVQERLDVKKMQGGALIQTLKLEGHQLLVVTAGTDQLLIKAAKFVANQELMRETSQAAKRVTGGTPTYTSTLQYDGSYQLTPTDDQLTGTDHQEKAYFVSLPTDRTNANGSTIHLKFRYAKNLNFKQSLVTIKVNGQPIGSRRLSAARADNDELTVKLPPNKALSNAFTIQVGFDLMLPGQDNDRAVSQTPWATVLSGSQAFIKSQPNRDLLFDNYPSTFIKNRTFNHVVVVAPQTMAPADFATMTNLFNLMGNFVQQNTGTIQVYRQQPSRAVLKTSSVIAFGTPAQNSLIRQLNSQLYFQFNRQFTGFRSNEKLSLESRYAQDVGTAQLIRSPYNAQRALLVVTASKPTDVYRASTQINLQRNVQQYRDADAILVDRDNHHFSYRFKKNKALRQAMPVPRLIQTHSQLLLFLAAGLGCLAILGGAVILILRKNGFLKREAKHDAR
jgi:hypothetical protein